MPTIVTKTVGPGLDYENLAAFEAGEQRDLVSADEIARASCANFLDTSVVTFSGWTTDATRYIEVIAADLHGSTGLVTTDAYRMVPSTLRPINLAGANMHLHLVGLQLSAGSSATTILQLGASSFLRAKNCLIVSTGNSAAPFAGFGASSVSELINCIVISNNTTYSYQFTGNLSEAYLYNCTANGGMNINSNPDLLVMKNCYLSKIDDFGVDVLTLVTTATGDASGSAGLQNIDPVDAFVDSDGDDYFLKIGSPLIDTGTDTSAEGAPFDFTDDFSQDPTVVRPALSGWDIGAFEFALLAPVADFTMSPESGEVPFAVRFTNTSVGTVDSYLWDFGDGSTSTEENPIHTFTSPGSIPVILTVTNTSGSDSYFKFVTAAQLPGVIAEPDTWAGKFTAGPPGVQFDVDRQAILDLGFTILDEEPSAGQTKIFVYGPGSAVNAYRGDTLNLVRMPAQFFLIPKGSRITISLVKTWVPREDSTF